MAQLLVRPGGWLISRRPCPNPMVRLVAVPPAGAGAGTYFDWFASLPPWLEMWAVAAPGREARVRQPAPRSMDVHVEGILEALDALPPLPLALFGHSMGGRVAWETAKALVAGGGTAPVHLFVSGLRAPSLPPDHPPEHALGDDALVDVVWRRYGGFPQQAETYPELMEMVLEVLRADLEALELQPPPGGPPLPSPLTALGGADDPAVPVADLEPWRKETTGPFDVRVMPGDHRYLEGLQREVLGVVVSALRGARHPPGRG